MDTTVQTSLLELSTFKKWGGRERGREANAQNNMTQIKNNNTA